MFIRFSGESLKLRNSSFLGPNRMNKLLNESSQLERDDFSSNRHPALPLFIEHDLFRKPVATFRDHALRLFAPVIASAAGGDPVARRLQLPGQSAAQVPA